MAKQDQMTAVETIVKTLTVVAENLRDMSRNKEDLATGGPWLRGYATELEVVARALSAHGCWPKHTGKPLPPDEVGSILFLALLTAAGLAVLAVLILAGTPWGWA